MDENISKGLRTTFLVHMIFAAIFGITLFLIPGRTLTLLGWVPEMIQIPQTELSAPGTIFVDPVISRVLGAALLGLAFSSFQGWRAQKWGEVALLVELEFVFCTLGVIAFLGGWYHMNRAMPLIGWVIMVILMSFALIWGFSWQRRQAMK